MDETVARMLARSNGPAIVDPEAAQRLFGAQVLEGPVVVLRTDQWVTATDGGEFAEPLGAQEWMTEIGPRVAEAAGEVWEQIPPVLLHLPTGLFAVLQGDHPQRVAAELNGRTPPETERVLGVDVGRVRAVLELSVLVRMTLGDDEVDAEQLVLRFDDDALQADLLDVLKRHRVQAEAIR